MRHANRITAERCAAQPERATHSQAERDSVACGGVCAAVRTRLPSGWSEVSAASMASRALARSARSARSASCVFQIAARARPRVRRVSGPAPQWDGGAKRGSLRRPQRAVVLRFVRPLGAGLRRSGGSLHLGGSLSVSHSEERRGGVINGRCVAGYSSPVSGEAGPPWHREGLRYGFALL